MPVGVRFALRQVKDLFNITLREKLSLIDNIRTCETQNLVFLATYNAKLVLHITFNHRVKNITIISFVDKKSPLYFAKMRSIVGYTFFNKFIFPMRRRLFGCFLFNFIYSVFVSFFSSSKSNLPSFFILKK